MNEINFKLLAEKLLSNSTFLLSQWLPQGKLIGREYVSTNPMRSDASPGSFKINVDTGTWSDFALSDPNSRGGDLISLYAYLNNLGQFDAAKHLANGSYESYVKPQSTAAKTIKWTSLAKAEGEPPALLHRMHGKPTKSWEYKDAEGSLVGYVCRFDTKEGKQFAPFCYCENDKGTKAWRWQGFLAPRPLYRLDSLVNNPNEDVLIVEGEKACDAAQLLFPEMVCVSWCGGANGIGKTDFEPLKGRNLYLWPDNDTPGKAAMSKIHHMTGGIIVNPPKHAPEGWDLADPLENFDAAQHLRDQTAIVIPKPPLEFVHYKGITPCMTIENLRIMLDYYGVNCRYNVISKEVEFIIPELSATRENLYNIAYGWIASKLHELHLPTSFYKEFALNICDQNPYNPVKSWIESKPWDGKNRLEEFFATIDAENNEAKEWFIYRWMIGAVAAAMSPDGIDSSGIIVLQGAQDIGKTWWFRKLCPPELQRADATVNPADRDSVEQVIGYWLVELGELDATFRKADIAALKGFITRNSDTLRKSYAARASTYPRRTAFAASVNEVNFLHDDENRRYWTIECKKINSYHTIDMQQVWAQIYQDWLSGEKHTLEETAKKALRAINKEHQQIEPIYEMLLAKYDWNMCHSFDYKTATQIAQDLGLKSISKRETREITKYVLEINGNRKKRTSMERLLAVPMLLNQAVSRDYQTDQLAV